VASVQTHFGLEIVLERESWCWQPGVSDTLDNGDMF